MCRKEYTPADVSARRFGFFLLVFGLFLFRSLCSYIVSSILFRSVRAQMIKKQTALRASQNRQKTSAVASVKNHQRSPKIQALLQLIDGMEASEKAVIFSQWTSVLDIIAVEFRSLGHTFTRIDGTMDAAARYEAMEDFDTEGCDDMTTPRFILCSLHACGTGINLTRGNVVFMLDPVSAGSILSTDDPLV